MATNSTAASSSSNPAAASSLTSPAAASSPRSNTTEEVKSVLVCVGERKRAVSFSIHPTPKAELQALLTAIASAFEDVPNVTTPLALQLKNEDWGGEILDVVEGKVIPDKSVIRVIQESQACEVSAAHSDLSACNLTFRDTLLALSFVTKIVYCRWHKLMAVSVNECFFLTL